MSNGFQSADETKIAIAVKRLTPSAKRGDIQAFSDGVQQMRERYGQPVAEEAMNRILKEHRELSLQLLDRLPKESQLLIQDEAFDILAEVVEAAGLRLEDHFRITDKGIALTAPGLKAIADTGFPKMEDFGKPFDSLEGVGLKRISGFYHPLCETFEHRGEDCVNSWAVASMCINSAAGWLPDVDSEQGYRSLELFVSQVSPTADVRKLLWRSRFDDRALMRLCQLAADGMTAKAAQSIR
ncbi:MULTISPECIES: hypothetical protein [Leptolyngbya]|uniref:hypothetical protein n=1 Tax=Leptolyngbya TaxID=47251 RepID=UPI001688C3F3|nr:hypothetical protein [Leptolyngbya sp. FACHB-1624]MBD1857709.1 hypothetical protein [Leptolyngbya sp. FACHB-1624]